MAIEIMIQVLAALDRKLNVENRKGLFPDSASFHPETLQGNLKSIKLVFLPQNTTFQLQPCDAGIIGSFKIKYHKQVLKHINSRIDDGKKHLKLFKGLIFCSV